MIQAKSKQARVKQPAPWVLDVMVGQCQWVAIACFMLLSLCFTSVVYAQAKSDIQNPSPAMLKRLQRASVGLLAVTQGYDPFLPWKKSRLRRRWGSAVVASNKLLITTALLVRRATLLQVYPKGHGRPYTAEVVRVDPQVNLALLQVNDASFWQQVRPLPLRDSLRHNRFLVTRWLPDGRFEQAQGQTNGWSNSAVGLGQIEFPVLRGRINLRHLGNGEMLVGADGMVGMAIHESNGQLRVLSARILRLFLESDSAGGLQNTFAQRGFAWQPFRHPALRTWFKAGRNGGVLIRKVHITGTGSRVLQKGDILRKLAGYSIDAEGNIQHEIYGQVVFTLLFNNRAGTRLPAEIVRNGKKQNIHLKRSRFSPDALRVHPAKWGRAPHYALFGGLVIQELGFDFFAAWGKNWRTEAPSRLVVEALQNSLRKQGEPSQRVVFISQVLADPINQGYEDVQGSILDKVNGEKIRNLNQLKNLLSTQNRSNMQKPLVIQLLPGQGRTQMVFNATQIEEANLRIAKRYQTPLH